MVIFGVNVVQRVRHVTHKDHRHLWRILYERTGLLLDVAILALQAVSKYNTSCTLRMSACCDPHRAPSHMLKVTCSWMDVCQVYHIRP